MKNAKNPYFQFKYLQLCKYLPLNPGKDQYIAEKNIFLDTGKFLIFTKDTDFSKKIKMNYTSQDLETFSKVGETSEAIQYFFQL